MAVLEVLRPTGTTTLDSDGAAITGITNLADDDDDTFISSPTLTESAPDYTDTSIKYDFGTFSLPTDAVVKREYFDYRHRLHPEKDSAGIYSYIDIGGAVHGSQSRTPLGVEWVTRRNGPHSPLHVDQSAIDDISVVISAGSDPSVDPGVTTGGYELAEVWYYVEYNPKPDAPYDLGPVIKVNNTRRPTLYWIHDDSHERQYGCQIKLFTDAVHGGGGFDVESSATVVDATVATSSSSYRVPSNLTEGQTYWMYVRTSILTSGVQQWSDWSESPVSFTVDTNPLTPTAIVPVQGQVVTTSRPGLDADGAAYDYSRREWALRQEGRWAHTDPNAGDGWDEGVWDTAVWDSPSVDDIVVQENISRGTHNSAPAFMCPVPLAQGRWFVRSRLIRPNVLGTSPTRTEWSPAQSFWVEHLPVARIVGPSGGANVAYASTVNLQWKPTDPYVGDSQTAYQIEVWQLSDPAGTIIDTGKVASAGSLNVTQTAGVSVDETWQETDLRWRIRLWDSDDVVGPWSTETSFYLRVPPEVTILDPVDEGVAISAAPTFMWDYATVSGGEQTAYRVLVEDASTGQVIHDSGLVEEDENIAPAMSYSLPEPMLLLLQDYELTITLFDSYGLSGSSTHTFTADYIAPTPTDFVLGTLNFEPLARIEIDWSSSTVDVDNIGWSLYRKLLNEANWVEILRAPSETVSYFDYLAPSDNFVEYAVTQINDDGFGGEIQSTLVPKTIDVTGRGSSYWLIVPDRPELNTKIYHVTGDDFGDEREVASLNLIGRGRRVEYGTNFGQSGTLNAELRDNDEMTARQQRLWIDSIRNSALDTYLRNPFGDVWKVAIESASLSRVAGVGMRAHSTLSLSYFEVTDKSV